MVRKFKYHEQKLLKKVDFLKWKADNEGKENIILRRFHIRRREDYTAYNKLSRQIRDLGAKIAKLDKSDKLKLEFTMLLLEKLNSLGLAKSKLDLEETTKISASSFCRRRLPFILCRNKMAPNMKSAVELIEAGHVRVGPEIVKDPAFIVSRNLEDFITWVDGSKIKQHILKYNGMRDDFSI